MPVVRITECLCPQRHCIMGIAYHPGVTAAGGSGMDDITLSPDTAPVFLKSIVESADLNPWCRLCGSREFHYEDSSSDFKTIAEANLYLNNRELECARAHATAIVPEPIQLTDHPKITYAELKESRVYILCSPRFTVSLNYMGVNKPASILADRPAFTFYAPAIDFTAVLLGRPDGSVEDLEGNLIELRRYTGEDGGHNAKDKADR